MIQNTIFSDSVFFNANAWKSTRAASKHLPPPLRGELRRGRSARKIQLALSAEFSFRFPYTTRRRLNYNSGHNGSDTAKIPRLATAKIHANTQPPAGKKSGEKIFHGSRA